LPGGNYVESEIVTWEVGKNSEAAMGGAQRRILYITVQGREGGGAFNVAVFVEVAISQHSSIPVPGEWYFCCGYRNCFTYNNIGICERGKNNFKLRFVWSTIPTI
jgi:hypothetical protein